MNTLQVIPCIKIGAARQGQQKNGIQHGKKRLQKKTVDLQTAI